MVRERRFKVIGILITAAFLGLVTPAFAGVSVSLQPASSSVEPGAIFKIYIHVDSAGSEFNGYEAVVRWNQQILDFVSVQPESLFNQYSNYWWAPEIYADHVLISHVILEGGATETGPGDLSSITFEAAELGDCPVTFDYAEFYRFGFVVSPVEWHDALVRVVDPGSGVPAEEEDSSAEIRILPNPVHRDGSIHVRAPARAPAELRLFDVGGRLIWERVVSPGSSMRFTFDPSGDLRDLRSGVYFAQLAAGGRGRTVRFLRIDQ